MILCIAEILKTDDLAKVRALLARGRYVDGRQTAGWHARLVKNNRQAESGGPADEAGEIIHSALLANPLFRAAALPRTIRPMLFSRYEPGMEYGPHVDDAIMGRDQPMRTDISMTVFLGDPDSYGGGELVMESTAGEQAYKLAAGSAIIYPSTTLHRVAPVTTGVREVAVTWIQSLVRHADRREVLFDLENVRRSLFQSQGKTAEFDLLSKTVANLTRTWAEP